MKNRHFKPGDTVYAWSNERYGVAFIVECDVEAVEGDDLRLYAGYDNRSFYRKANDVMNYTDLMECIDVIKKDHDNAESWANNGGDDSFMGK